MNNPANTGLCYAGRLASAGPPCILFLILVFEEVLVFVFEFILILPVVALDPRQRQFHKPAAAA